MKRFLFTAFIAFNAGNLYSQNQINNWFFSGNNGLNFSSGRPLNISGGQITVMEGACAVSDRRGQLLFYTDGITVWNKNHDAMANGQGLAGGNGSSTQSCIVVPKTSDEKQYYIFTTDEEGGKKGLQYSVVDMAQSNGLGAVIQKNQPLVTPCCEKITAVRHCNKKDYWVITHQYGSDAYYAYLVGENGVDSTPVISHTGSTIPVAYATMAGVLKASPNGKKIIAMHSTIGAELSDFNNQTGVLANTTEIFGNSNANHYGAEFSADSKMLYISVYAYWYQPDLKRYAGVFQFDLSRPTPSAIINSKFEVYRYDPMSEVGTLQRGPDGKIYMSQYQKAYLSVINSPEVFGAACNFVDKGVLLPTPAQASLPNFLSDYRSQVDAFQFTINSSCVNTPVTPNYTATGDVTALLWDFGDPSSGTQNFASNAVPTHIYSTQGQYTVKLIKYSPCGNDTTYRQITVGDVQLSLGADTAFCDNSPYVIKPQTSGNASLLWQDGSTSPTYNVVSSGLYWAQATGNGNDCVKRDSVSIIIKPNPVVKLGNDTAICPGASLLLNAFNTGAEYRWQDNTTNATLLVDGSGTYWVEANIDGCKTRDSIRVDESCTVRVPSAFTPNNDGVNDHFRVLGTGFIDKFDLKIFNRYGQVVYQTRDSRGYWNGDYNHVKSPEGVYVYLIKYNEINSTSQKILKGTVLLMR